MSTKKNSIKNQYEQFDNTSNAEDILDELDALESALLKGSIDPSIQAETNERINRLTARSNAELNKSIVDLMPRVHETILDVKLIEKYITQIEHEDLKTQAETRYEGIKELYTTLDIPTLSGPNFDISTMTTININSAISKMFQIQKQRIIVEGLLLEDKKRRNRTTNIVTAYIGTVFVAVIILGIFSGRELFINKDLKEFKLPILGIPWPVLVWSLVGSFVAMIHRFNADPISQFKDAVKWMVTRPAQGVILGAVTYLVLTAGWLLNPSPTDTIILLVCFLVGFSDRFANSVLNLIVGKFSKSGVKPDLDDSKANG